MLRYENFRLLLREELGVRPEPATLKLIDQLRQIPASPTRQQDSVDAAAPKMAERAILPSRCHFGAGPQGDGTLADGRSHPGDCRMAALDCLCDMESRVRTRHICR